MMIRVATPLDISALYGMLHVMHSETVHDVSPIRSDKLVAAISKCIHDGVVLVAEIDGRIIGSIEKQIDETNLFLAGKEDILSLIS